MADIERLLARARELANFGEAVAAGATTTANVGAFTKGFVDTDYADDERKKKKEKKVGKTST